METKSNELTIILTKFAESGWDVIDTPSKTWLEAEQAGKLTNEINLSLINAVKQADEECGSCGCEFDPLYKRALELL